MEKIYFPKNMKVYWPLIALFVILLIMMPRSPKFNYDYHKGKAWQYETLIAQYDFPILKTEAQLQKEKQEVLSSFIPYYRFDTKTAASKMSALSKIDLGEYNPVKGELAKAMSVIYEKGVLSTLPEALMEASNNDERLIYVQKDKRLSKAPASEFFTLDEAKLYFYAVLLKKFPECNIDSLKAETGFDELIAVDLVYDAQTTDLLHNDSIDKISLTDGVCRVGSVIVNKGDIVTSEIEQLLDSYKAEYDNNIGYNGPVAFLWIGNAFVALALVVIIFFSLYFSNYKVFEQYNKYLYLLMIYALSAIGTFIVVKVNTGLFHLIPFTILALYLTAFFKKRVVYTIYTASLLPMLIFAPNGVELFFMYLVAGTVGIIVFDYFNKGWLQFVTALIVFVALALMWVAFRFIEGVGLAANYNVVLNLFLGAMLTVAAYPLIYLFERMFRLVSTTKLVELSDTSNKLLRELADKAPGTFQHSLQVMNIADAAARAIDADVALVRCGALYHDVGKIANPQCFTENETPGTRYHADLTPQESAHDIIRHVSDGLALADKYGLPPIIKDFINTHHGTTCTAYFYNKYVNAGGAPDSIEDFRYDGQKPLTKEQVVLMFSDSIEAASRSLKDYSSDKTDELVDRIIDGKISDGQLDNADISLAQINTIKEVIKTYIQQMYHSRVAYPKRRIKNDRK